MSRNLAIWLEFIGQQNSSKINLGLERVERVASDLGLAQFSCPVVMIAGTNGKGSMAAYLQALYADYRVGAYTSPHLHQYNERICINSLPVEDDVIIAAFERIEAIRSCSLSYFEFNTLAALLIFQQADLDLVVLEVGLGGRLDAVNIVDADVSVVTAIGLDHQQWLGDSIEDIAKEKAGIYKKDKFAVCGMLDAPDVLAAYAEKVGVSQFFQIGRDYTYINQQDCWGYRGSNQLDCLPLTQLRQDHAATALKVTELLPLSITADRCQQALAETALAGRFECWRLPMPIIFDVAHNPQAAHYLLQQIQRVVKGKVLAVAGMLATKDIDATLFSMDAIVSQWYLADLNVNESVPAHQLLRACGGDKHLPSKSFDSVAMALEQAMKDFDLCSVQAIIVFGSFHAVQQGQEYLMLNKGSLICKQNYSNASLAPGY